MNHSYATLRISGLPSSQTGWASLAIGVILLAVASIGSLYLSRSTVLDLHSSRNKIATAEAMSRAEALLDAALAKADYVNAAAQQIDLLNTAIWVPCTNIGEPYKTRYTDGWQCARCAPSSSNLLDNWTCTPIPISTTSLVDAVIFARRLVNPLDSSQGYLDFYYANAISEDPAEESTTLVRQAFSLRPLLNIGQGGFPPPLMATGNVPLNGNFSVAANPNGAGLGVPVSVWTRVSIDPISGSASTCQIGDYIINNDCSVSPLTNRTIGKGPDIIDNDASFPDDVFKYVFGVDSVNYESIKKIAQQTGNYFTTCASIGGRTGLVWVEGNCDISGTNNGTETQPILLVVESGDIRMNAGSALNGLMFAFGPDENAGNIQVNGTATLRGSIISNDASLMGVQINGTFNALFSNSVSGFFSSPDTNRINIVVKQPGTWVDYLDPYN